MPIAFVWPGEFVVLEVIFNNFKSSELMNQTNTEAGDAMNWAVWETDFLLLDVSFRNLRYEETDSPLEHHSKSCLIWSIYINLAPPLMIPSSSNDLPTLRDLQLHHTAGDTWTSSGSRCDLLTDHYDERMRNMCYGTIPSPGSWKRLSHRNSRIYCKIKSVIWRRMRQRYWDVQKQTMQCQRPVCLQHWAHSPKERDNIHWIDHSRKGTENNSLKATIMKFIRELDHWLQTAISSGIMISDGLHWLLGIYYLVHECTRWDLEKWR